MLQAEVLAPWHQLLVLQRSNGSLTFSLKSNSWPEEIKFDSVLRRFWGSLILAMHKQEHRLTVAVVLYMKGNAITWNKLGLPAFAMRENSQTGSKNVEVPATRLVIASTGAMLIVGGGSAMSLTALACRTKSADYTLTQVSGISDASKTQLGLIRIQKQEDAIRFRLSVNTAEEP